MLERYDPPSPLTHDQRRNLSVLGHERKERLKKNPNDLIGIQLDIWHQRGKIVWGLRKAGIRPFTPNSVIAYKFIAWARRQGIIKKSMLLDRILGWAYIVIGALVGGVGMIGPAPIPWYLWLVPIGGGAGYGGYVLYKRYLAISKRLKDVMWTKYYYGNGVYPNIMTPESFRDVIAKLRRFVPDARFEIEHLDEPPIKKLLIVYASNGDPHYLDLWEDLEPWQKKLQQSRG